MKRESFKMIVIGNAGVGKTSLVRKFSKGLYTSNYTMTIGIEFESKTIFLDEKKIQLQIWDTVILKRLDKKNINL